jgi:hypothetical protein
MTPDLLPDDPEVVATLEAIDATLAGQAVDPRHAEVAELALMLAAERPVMSPASAAELDEHLPWRAGASPARRPQRARWWLWAPSAAVAASLAVAIVIVVGQGGSGSPAVSLGTTAQGVASGASRAAEAPIPAAHRKASRAFSLAVPKTLWRTHSGAGSASGARGPAGPAGPAGAETLSQTSIPAPVNGPGTPLSPPTAGRKVIQGAQLALSTSARRVDQVAQEVFNVVGQQKGIVKNSSVTSNGTHGGYAQFQLSIPSANLAQTMSALSNLSYADVVSRTDSSQDVTNQYDVDQRHLADDRALRISLLKQLADAVTQAQIDSLDARIHLAEQAITADENALHSLEHQIGYSQIFLTINAGSVPVPVQHGGGGFNLGRAAHDAGRVLTVAAGVALIGLAALLPVGLVLALLWWIYGTVRRRRRLQALDLY